ncbi:septum formation inhibitor Maf [Vallitalea pronyensis]|uniref:dTTP/UTP pyrophosphatase n=1 Tax=Vallitalea pronyensis TaxID=1348613 RepID=A0A8J8MKE5_9FIRM|nr:Maf family protein [Vallitalea pronyensis]QUI23330.1 septum formation inhibitor Maf [Vallitalea pronyensis]
MKRIVLASGSPRRKELLERLKLAFDVRVSQIDEDIFEQTSPHEYVETLAMEKAKDVASHLDEKAIVIGCDTVVVLDDKILGKPCDDDQAMVYLQALSGRAHEVYSGMAILDMETGKQYLTHEITTVTMKSLNHDEIVAYVKTGEPADKAGAYGIQGIGSILVEGIHGDYYNVMGLPLNRLYQGFHALGIDYFSLV